MDRPQRAIEGFGLFTRLRVLGGLRKAHSARRYDARVDSFSRENFLGSIAASHGRQLMRFFLSRVPEPSEAQDLVQEVYLRMLKLGRPDLIRSPKAYLYRIAANIAREHWLKRTALPPHIAFQEGPDMAASAADTTLETRQRLEQLATILGELSPKVRAALIWAHRDGHTYEEISTRLSVPKNRVKKYLARALAHCRKGDSVEEDATL